MPGPSKSAYNPFVPARSIRLAPSVSENRTDPQLYKAPLSSDDRNTSSEGYMDVPEERQGSELSNFVKRTNLAMNMGLDRLHNPTVRDTTQGLQKTMGIRTMRLASDYRSDQLVITTPVNATGFDRQTFSTQYSQNFGRPTETRPPRKQSTDVKRT